MGALGADAGALAATLIGGITAVGGVLRDVLVVALVFAIRVLAVGLDLNAPRALRSGT